MFTFFRNELDAIPTPSRFNDAISHIIAKKLSDIYYGRVEHPWAVEVENWTMEHNTAGNKRMTAEGVIDQQLLHY